MSHVAARREIRELIDNLRLPMGRSTLAPVPGEMMAALVASPPLTFT
jgi:hypothetical protein